MPADSTTLTEPPPTATAPADAPPPGGPRPGSGPPPLYGLLAAFADPESLLAAARRTRAEGYRRFDAYSPFSIEGLSDAVGFHDRATAVLTLLGAAGGGAAMYGLQWYSSVVDYRFNVGGRPLNSWPAFLLLAAIVVILAAGTTAGAGMVLLNGLPRLNHPVFNSPEFLRASQDRFFLCVEAADGKFEPAGTRAFLESLEPLHVEEVSR